MQKRPCHSFFELSMTKKVFGSGFCVSGMLLVVVSLACVSSETDNLHAFFVVLKKGFIVPGIPCRDCGNWD